MSQWQLFLQYATTVTVVLIPIGTFTTNVFIASLAEIDRDGEPRRTISKRAARCLLDSLFGGWVAVALLQHPFFKEYQLNSIGMPIIGAAMTFAMPWFRIKIPPMAAAIWDGLKEMVLNWLASRVNRKFDVQPRTPQEPDSESQS